MPKKTVQMLNFCFSLWVWAIPYGAMTLARSANAAPLTLLEGFEAHRQSSEKLQSQRLSLQMAKEATQIAQPTLIPDLSAEAGYAENDDGVGGADRSSTAKAVLSKNILGLWKYGPASNATHLAEQQETLTQKDLTKRAFSDFTGRFLDCLFLQRELEILADQRKSLQDQIGVMRKRVRIGRNKQSDLLTFLSREKTFESLETIKHNSHRICLADLSRQTGLGKIEALAIPSIQPDQVLVKSEAEILASSPTLQIYDLQLKQNEELMRANDRTNWPDLTAFAEYYGHRDGTASDDSKWGFGLKLTWAIYSGYREAGQQSILTLQSRQVELLKTDAQKELQLKISSAQETLKGLQAKTRLLKENFDLAKENRNTFRRDFNYGLVSNLDLLNSINLLIDAENLYLSSEKELQVAYWDLYAEQQNWDTL